MVGLEFKSGLSDCKACALVLSLTLYCPLVQSPEHLHVEIHLLRFYLQHKNFNILYELFKKCGQYSEEE